MTNYKAQPVLSIPCQFPLAWLWSCCCPFCFAAIHRVETLGDKWPADYYLCQNYLEDIHPCLKCCPETANAHPYLCLCLESFCFAGGAIGGSRYYISKENGLEDTGLEKCCGICLTISIFCGMVGSMYAIWFNSCLGNQQVAELKDKGKSVKQPIAAGK
eukprot:CAMPEP_0201516300 /NCGR_PEP_ID=MMETSP0161_2-20130828/7661_1 /ASSEMBLY_ACC=CAM_ASM_000251 /TAXON_ID=180227 /ORGANISM="Neoparamoeba aestuarina, Strain SoJaBio B1-5/56/2" /LENGTH=158 /DNA_ID=CAMNT_0047913375 /DNA_START=61 /DNA_END=537 /DNA_ORIENTATION=+